MELTTSLTETNIKYFTPNIEDIHVGYECEYLNGGYTGMWIHGFGLGSGGFPSLEEIKNKAILLRTTYLTKEQIATELPSWVQKKGGSYIFESDKFYMPIFLKGHKSFFRRIYFHPEDGPWVKIVTKTIGSEKEETLFEGRVKSINEFRNLIYNYLEFEKK